MSAMTDWIVEPRDTLVIRDGRPIQEASPAMRSLDLPWPSSIAGFARTRAGMDERGHFAMTPEEARSIAVVGPWLVSMRPDGDVHDLLVPAPADCVFFDDLEGGRGWRRHRLAPMPPRDGCRTDLGDLEVVGLRREAPSSKPSRTAPRLWRWREMEDWLRGREGVSALAHESFGQRALEHERRVHVSVDPASGTAADGKLFSTDGLRFATRRREPDAPAVTERRIAIGLSCSRELNEGPVVLGGERRLSYLRRAGRPLAPALPDWLARTSSKEFRVVLLTPAIFETGFGPASFGTARVTACVVGRPEVISGWDLAAGGPKATRRMAPAGSVYWVTVDSGDPAEWVRGNWMKCVSDSPQDRADGFGLCAVGAA
jgi:CRISPR-associated protein Cmr3